MTPETVHFTMERFDDEAGVYYVITGVEIALVTDGPTIEEALRNLREAVDLYYEGRAVLELEQRKLPRKLASIQEDVGGGFLRRTDTDSTQVGKVAQMTL
jgi:predicted RNase H-like HicB family nuclease